MAAPAANEMEAGRDQRPATVKVWDPFVRIFHWSLVTLFAVAWFTEDAQTVHQTAGYLILALVALRVVWGFAGSQHARFGDFVRSPRKTLAYARDLVSGKAARVLGHNPLAAMMIVTLLLMLTATGASGWLTTVEPYRSAEWVEELHETLASLTLAFVGVHVLAAVVMSVVHRENLVRAMFTGRKRP